MKEGITLWIEDNVVVKGFCGTIFLESADKKTNGADGATCFNLNASDFVNGSDWFCPRVGQPEKIKDGEAHNVSDYISREAALKILNSVIIRFDELKPKHELIIIKSAMEKMADEIVKALVNLPSVEPERKTGHWIKHYDDLFPEESTIECSECHNHQDITIDDSYCPNCGADMREVQSGSCE